jgi:hypothetical protein
MSSIVPGGFLGALEFLVCGLPGKRRAEQLFLMLVAHIDDSGAEGPKRGQAATLAGFVGRAEVWHEFSGRWKDALNEHPKIDYFRMVEAHRRRDQFREHSEQQRDDRVAKLGGLIGDAKQHLHAVASVVWWEDFAEFRQHFTNPIQAYIVLFQSTVLTVLDTVRLQYPGEQVELIFDDQGLLGSKAASINDWCNLSLSHRYRKLLAGRPVHRSDKVVIPLQAADFLAWHIRRGCDEKKLDLSQMPAAFDGMRVGCRILSRAKLARMAMHARELIERFPDIQSMYTEAELKEVRNRFLGYDPDSPQDVV